MKIYCFLMFFLSGGVIMNVESILYSVLSLFLPWLYGFPCQLRALFRLLYLLACRYRFLRSRLAPYFV